MTLVAPPETLLRSFSDHVAGQIGLSLPPARWPDLLRATTALANDSGLPDAQAIMQRWLAAPLQPAQVQALARHLVVGETSFFREPAAFDALERHALSPLILQRRAQGRRELRVWSAGCSTGEELYTLAIVLRRLLPDAADWVVTLLGTDIHPGFLEHARRGIYGDWSFRGVAGWVQRLHFEAMAPGRHAVRAELRRGTDFRYLNLAAEPGLDMPAAMDVVLCRHVLMYFDAAQAARAVRRLRGALAPDGWLVVGAVETGARLFEGFNVLPCRGAVLHRKQTDPVATPHAAPRPAHDDPAPAPAQAAAADSSTLAANARSLADQGRNDQALDLCRAALALDKCNADLHYLHALIEEERAQFDQAEAALRRVLYLDPDFGLARFALARLAARQGRPEQAARHLSAVIGAKLAQA